MRYRRTEFVPDWVREFHDKTWLLPTYSRWESFWLGCQQLFFMAVGCLISFLIVVYGILGGGPEAAERMPTPPIGVAIIMAIVSVAIVLSGMIGLPGYIYHLRERRADMVRDAQDWIEREMSRLFDMYWSWWKSLEQKEQRAVLLQALATLAHLVNGASGKAPPVIKESFRQGRAMAEFLLHIAPDSTEAEELEISALTKAYPLDKCPERNRFARQVLLGKVALEAEEQRTQRRLREVLASR